MASSLFDIAPATETVVINGAEHRVYGLPLRIVTEIVKKNPALVSMLGGGGLTAEAILDQGPEAVSTIIAAGYGMPDDEKAKKHAANLPLDVQLDLIAAIVKATLGGGAGPFAEKVKRVYESFGMGKTAETEREEKLEIAKRRLSKIQSQRRSNSSSPAADTHMQPSGI